MLVLTRRIDEKIVVNDNIIITVLAIEGEKVKIGITAPREVTVLRHELWQAIQNKVRLRNFSLSSQKRLVSRGCAKFWHQKLPKIWLAKIRLKSKPKKKNNSENRWLR